MRRIILWLFFFQIVSAQQLPLKREARGAWIATVANIDWPSTTSNVDAQKKQLITILDSHAASGINIVIFQIRPECDALYNSPYEPWSRWLTGNQGTPTDPMWDPLEFAVEEAHKRGMELHAWFNPYRAERSVGDYPTAATHVTNTHPEWILQVGSIRFLNPGLQAVRDHVAKIISDVVRRYDVDAAHMDDYFYVQGVSTQDADTYAADSRGLSLGDWRRDNVNMLIKQVYDSIQTIKPWVKWGISPAGIWKNGVPAGIIGNDVYSVLYCDAVAWMQGAYIDYLAPQLYWKIGGSQDFTLLLPWWHSVSNGRQMIPGLAAYRIGELKYGNADMIGSQIRYYRENNNAVGNFLYTTNSITGNFGGLNDSLKNDLYKYRALVPSMNWKDAIPPNPPLNARFGRYQNSPVATITWDVPSKAADNDTASMYVIYQPATPLSDQTTIDDSRNITSITSERSFNPSSSKKTSPNYFVTSLDRNHNESAPSSIVTISNIPAQPLLAYPANNAPDQAPSVQLAWNYAASSSAYALQVSSDSNFSILVLSPQLLDTTMIVTTLQGEQEYFWRVKGVNIAGDGLFSQIRKFSTGFPANPVLLLPNDIQVNTPLSMQFAWKKNPIAASYHFQLSRSSDFTLLVKDTAGYTDTTVTQENLIPYTIYFWRVNSTNAIGSSGWASKIPYAAGIVCK